MGVWQIMFALQYHSPDEELLRAHMEDVILVNRQAGTSRSVAALQVPFTDHLIHNVVDALARPGDVEVKCHSKARSRKTVPAKEKMKGGPGGAGSPPQGQGVGPLQVGRCQICTDLQAAGLVADNSEEQTLDVLLTLWRQLCPEQKYRPMDQGQKARLPSKAARSDTSLLLS